MDTLTPEERSAQCDQWPERTPGPFRVPRSVLSVRSIYSAYLIPTEQPVAAQLGVI